VEIFELYITTHFSSAHLLKGHPGECARLHGHNWLIEVFVRCHELNEIGIGIDFKDIKQEVKEVLQTLDHQNLSELPAFEHINPTCENIAKYLYVELSRRINTSSVQVSKIKISETPTAGASYWQE